MDSPDVRDVVNIVIWGLPKNIICIKLLQITFSELYCSMIQTWDNGVSDKGRYKYDNIVVSEIYRYVTELG